MNEYRYVIVGGGPTAGYSAREFAEQGVAKGELAIVTADSYLPYDRPPLSKGFLKGDKDVEGVLIESEAFYDKHGIEVHLDCRVTRVDTEKKRLETDSGDTLSYEKLLVATGSELRMLDVDGAHEADLHYLRVLDDAKRIRDAGAEAESPVVIGGGFIGMEVAAGLAHHGKNVRMVFPEEYLMPKVFTQRMASFFAGYYSKRGVECMPGNAVHRFKKSGGTTEIHLASEQKLVSDFVVAGMGVKPAVSLFLDTPIGVDDGVCVDELLETTVEGIYAAGDVAAFPDPLSGRRERVEHWQNAVDQGKLAARNMMGAHEPYTASPYFFSDMFDLSWEYWGRAGEGMRAVHVGKVEEGAFSTWWVDERGIVKAAFVLNQPDDERELAKDSVAQGEKLPAEIEKAGKE